MRIRIEPYKQWSGGAKALGIRAGILRATTKQVRKYGDFDYIINWGNSKRRFNGQYINNPEAVVQACNKLDAAKCFDDADIPQPDFTTDKSVAEGWLNDGHAVVARRLLRANSGRGIVLCDPSNGPALPKAPMYTKYIKKSTEYRIHVFADQVIDTQEKRRKMEVPDEQINWQIRNTDGGFIFARSDVAAPVCCTDAAVRSVAALGLDFGAVDIGYNALRDKCRVYEVNTAPGLSGSTVDSYYEALKSKLPALEGGAYRRRRVV